MQTAMDDQSVAQRILEHIANGTTDTGRTVWREPVENYRSEQRLEAEIARVKAHAKAYEAHRLAAEQLFSRKDP